ncbi:MAG: ATP-dependent DNA helicase [Verrucomicrobiaceae bacterium]|nr:ATP-dependent DNA helicase [Verrucomicrobiaceae bacterium]
MSEDTQAEFKEHHLPSLCENIFCKDGYASILPNYEHRPEQEQMAFFCAQTYASGLPLIFEAGTGVGKSLAYLIGGIIAAKRFNKKLIIATNTIALQQQIIEKDLPRIRMLFENCDALRDCANFQEAILVGRANYICTNRLKRAVADKRELFNTEETEELERIANWAKTTTTGLREELKPQPNPEVWNWICAESSSCTPRTCDETCFYQNARKKAASADIVILNHSLLFSLINGTELGSDSILFENDMLVLDEAHLVPDAVSKTFGVSLSSSGIIRELKRIYNPKKRKGLITRMALAEYFDKKLIEDTIACVEDFFTSVRANRLQQRDTVRLEEPNWAEDLILHKLEEVELMLKHFAQNASTEKQAAEINDYKEKIKSYKTSLETCLYLTEDGYVYWLESSDSEKKITINSQPIDVAKILRTYLFDRSSPVIMTSATMAINGDLTQFAESVGAECAEKFVVNSPFDYQNNMRVFYATDAPIFERGQSTDNSELGACIEKLCFLVKGGTLILFTSYSEMKKIANLLKESAILQDRKIFVQGEDYGRLEILQEFTTKGNAILLGTDSFWTGVDIPGESLSQVIITKLPFDIFTHPLIEAKMERADNLGGNGFMDVMLPKAIIKFRQGCGRLIRTKKDKGDIVILDSRVASKGYGRYFLNSLPVSAKRFRIKNLDDAIIPELENLGIL